MSFTEYEAGRRPRSYKPVLATEKLLAPKKGNDTGGQLFEFLVSGRNDVPPPPMAQKPQTPVALQAQSAVPMPGAGVDPNAEKQKLLAAAYEADRRKRLGLVAG